MTVVTTTKTRINESPVGYKLIILENVDTEDDLTSLSQSGHLTHSVRSDNLTIKCMLR